MTNREALMNALDALDDATFEQLVFSRKSSVSERMEALVCRDCEKLHGGRCLHPDDDECEIRLPDWLGMACTDDNAIKEALR